MGQMIVSKELLIKQYKDNYPLDSKIYDAINLKIVLENDKGNNEVFIDDIRPLHIDKITQDLISAGYTVTNYPDRIDNLLKIYKVIRITWQL